MIPEIPIHQGGSPTLTLRQRPPLVLIPQHFGCLIFDRRTSRYQPFDEEATAILRQLRQVPAQQYLATLPDAERDRQRDFVEFFDQADFFHADGRLAAACLDVTPPADHLTGPLAVHLEIIGACNLTCTHCFAGTLPRNQNPLQLWEIDRLCGELAGIGGFRLGLTGGEPMMRQDLFDIIDAATAHGLHPCLTTNGLLITEDAAREFGRRDLVWLNVSLDGATAATNDAIRGPGTFEKVMAGLRVLGRHARFTLAFTITSANAHETRACAELARSVGAHTAVFRPMYPTGTGLAHMHLMPTFEQYTNALRQLDECLQVDEDLRGIDPFSPQHRDDLLADVTGNRGCGAANHVASISVQGEVNPCSFLGPDWDSGNIRERSFVEIWNQGHRFAAMRQMSGAGCSADGFSGGCRVRAQVYNGDVDAADPWQTQFVQLGGHAS